MCQVMPGLRDRYNYVCLGLNVKIKYALVSSTSSQPVTDKPRTDQPSLPSSELLMRTISRRNALPSTTCIVLAHHRLPVQKRRILKQSLPLTGPVQLKIS